MEETETRSASDQLRACNGNDIVKSGRQRKNRYLFALPGLVAPHASAGGRVGTLLDIHTVQPKMVLDLADGRKLLLRGQVAQSKKSWIMLRIQGSSISCKDVFDRVVVFDKTEWVDGASAKPNDEVADEVVDFEYGLSVSARGRSAKAAKTASVKRKRCDENDQISPALSDQSPGERTGEDEDSEKGGIYGVSVAAQRPKRSRTVKSYCEDENASEDRESDDEVSYGDDDDDADYDD